MSYQLICDGGCGESTEDSKDFEERGLDDKKQYCKGCIGVVDEFIEKRNSIHNKIQKIWIEDMDELTKEYQEEFPDVRLPD